MATLAEIKEWFRTGLKPTQIQFWATWDSFWHKDTPIPQSAIENLEETLTSIGSGGRFGIEDSIFNEDRNIDINENSLYFANTGVFEVQGLRRYVEMTSNYNFRRNASEILGAGYEDKMIFFGGSPVKLNGDEPLVVKLNNAGGVYNYVFKLELYAGSAWIYLRSNADVDEDASVVSYNVLQEEKPEIRLDLDTKDTNASYEDFESVYMRKTDKKLVIGKASGTWGHIGGRVEDQEDLVNYISEQTYNNGTKFGVNDNSFEDERYVYGNGHGLSMYFMRSFSVEGSSALTYVEDFGDGTTGETEKGKYQFWQNQMNYNDGEICCQTNSFFFRNDFKQIGIGNIKVRVQYPELYDGQIEEYNFQAISDGDKNYYAGPYYPEGTNMLGYYAIVTEPVDITFNVPEGTDTNGKQVLYVDVLDGKIKRKNLANVGGTPDLLAVLQEGYYAILPYDEESGEDSIYIGRENTNGNLNGLQVYQYNTNINGIEVDLWGENDIRLEAPNITLAGATTANQAISYGSDVSGNYTDRSLVDKAYVDSVAGGSSNITPNFNQVLGAGSSGFLVDDGTGSSEEITMTVASSDYADFSNMKIGVSGSYMSSAQNFSAKAKLLGVFNEAILAVVDGAERIRVNDNGTTFSYVPITYNNESVLRASMTTPAHVPSIGKVQEMIAGNTPNLQSILNLSSGANIATTDAENKNFFVNYTNTDTGYFYRLWAGRDQAFIVGRSGSTGFYAGETTATMACNDCPAYIIGQTGVNIQSNDGNVSLQGNAVLANGNNVITSVTNGINTVYADSDGVVDISSISGGGSNDDIPTLQQVVEAGAEGIAPYIDGEVGLRLGQSNSEGELQGIVCYPSNVNLQSTYVNLLATEALYAEARTGYTLTTFGGDITFNVPAGKFIVNENSVLTGNYGTITINPSTGTTFTIPHNFYNLYGNPVPSYVSVRFSKYSPDLMYYTTTVDETYITITFPTVPTETSLDLYWEVRP